MKLVFRQRLVSEGGYFADAEASARVDTICHAIRTARTWGEFRELLPLHEFERLPLWQPNGGTCEYIATPDHERGVAGSAQEDIERIRPDDPFDADMIPGFGDGDYPPFLEPEQDRFLPRSFCKRFGNRQTSFVSGSWWEFPMHKATEMKTELERMGFSVTIQE